MYPICNLRVLSASLLSAQHTFGSTQHALLTLLMHPQHTMTELCRVRGARAGTQHSCTHSLPQRTLYSPHVSPHLHKSLVVQGCRSQRGLLQCIQLAQEAPDPARQSQGSSLVRLQQAQAKKPGLAAARISPGCCGCLTHRPWLAHNATPPRRPHCSAAATCSRHHSSVPPHDVPTGQDATRLCSRCCSTARQRVLQPGLLCVLTDR